MRDILQELGFFTGTKSFNEVLLLKDMLAILTSYLSKEKAEKDNKKSVLLNNLKTILWAIMKLIPYDKD
jgi:hypothetical protein